ncbi:hypothetical protein O181_120366, partial [Austropuccinia psidii MF-1]|nr:hypothetical protein [Austropuccinia psidii MF-1]
TLEFQERSHRTDKDCSYLEGQGLENIVDCRKLREIIHTLPFTFQLKKNLKQEEWKDMDPVHQLHQPLKDLLQWRMENRRLNLDSHCEGLGESCQKIFLKDIPFKDLMVITKGWNPNSKVKLLEERESRIRENQSAIQEMEKQVNQKEHTLIPSGSQGINKQDSTVTSNHSGTRR